MICGKYRGTALVSLQILQFPPALVFPTKLRTYTSICLLLPMILVQNQIKNKFGRETGKITFRR
jgi:hypothetical protein